MKKSLLIKLVLMMSSALSTSEIVWGQEASLQLVSYNIRHGEGMDQKVNLERTAKVLGQVAPDLVALQEVDKNCTRSGKVDQAEKLGSLLNMHHAFGAFMDYQGGEYGMAILSRYPILESIRHVLPEGAEPRCALEVVVQPEGSKTPVSFVCIHNDWTDAKFRIAQVKALLAGLADRKHPVILAGDFNGPPTDPSLALFTKREWTIADKNGAKTFPSPEPEIEIDYFIYRGLGAQPEACTVIDEQQASDHRPIQMRIKL